jgi:curved DNA-binding protein CbpA
MRDLMESSIAERKKVLRELVLEWHPDKNNDPNAKDIFQFINAQRGWFLCE